MLKGLEVSVVKFSEIDLGDRIDADYFTKANLHIERELKNLHSHELREFGDFVASAFYPAATQLYSVGDTPFIRCVDCINYPFITKSQDDLFEKIPMSFVQENNGINLLGKNDIVITKVGSPCYASLVYEHDIVALSRTVMGLKNIQGINPFYLLVYLRSKYGFSQLLRARELTIQYQLTLERVRRILVYLPSSDFQQKIESLVKSAHAKLSESKSLYAQAEDTLLCELGLKDWQPKNEAVSIKTFSDFASSGRLDAEYYQSKYDELEKKIKSVPYKTVEELQLFNARGVQPDYVSDGTVSVVNSKHILENGLDYDNFEKTTAEFLNANDRAKIINGDILIYTTGANIGRTQAYLLSEESLASNHVNILRLKEVNPIYAALVLNSKIGRLQTEKSCTGSAQAELYPADIEKFIIPILPSETQILIAEKIQKSFELRKQSKELLEQAKRMVEEEIEK